MSQLISGLIGVVVGALLSAFIQTVTHHHAKRQRRQHLILLVCSILDEFCSDCQDAIEEEGDEYTPSRGGFVVPLPTGPAFPAEVDWTTMEQDLVRRILSLRPAVRRVDERLRQNWDDWSDPPDYKEVFAFRSERCGELRQEALELSASLRKKAKPPIWEADTDA